MKIGDKVVTKTGGRIVTGTINAIGVDENKKTHVSIVPDQLPAIVSVTGDEVYPLATVGLQDTVTKTSKK